MCCAMTRSLFVDPETSAIDTNQILAEAIPIAKLIGLFVAIALVPLVFVFLLGGPSTVEMLFVIVAFAFGGSHEPID